MVMIGGWSSESIVVQYDRLIPRNACPAAEAMSWTGEDLGIHCTAGAGGYIDTKNGVYRVREGP